MRGLMAQAASFCVLALAFSVFTVFGVGSVAALLGADLTPIILLALSVSGPALAGVVMSLRSGRGGLRKLFSDFRLSGLSFSPLVFVPLYAGAAIFGAWVTGRTLLVPGFTDLAAGFVAQMLVVAMLEEIGWRVYLLPKLMLRSAPVIAAAAVAAAWFAWHLPKFGVGPLFVMLLAIACLANTVIMTAMIVAPGWGLPACIVLHGSFNLSQVVIDPVTASMPVQYGAFAAVTIISSAIATIIFFAQRSWFLRVPEGN